MSKKETFTPIWNFDDPDEKNGRKKATIKELDRERGKRGEDKKQEEMVSHGGMFEEDRVAHKMTKKKEKAIAVVVIIVAIIVTLLMIILNSKWRRDAFARRYLAAPQSSWSAILAADMPQTDTL